MNLTPKQKKIAIVTAAVAVIYLYTRKSTPPIAEGTKGSMGNTGSGTGTLFVRSDTDGKIRVGGSTPIFIKANIPVRIVLTPQTLNPVTLPVSIAYSDGTTSPSQTVTIVAGQTKTVTFTKPSTSQQSAADSMLRFLARK